MNDNKKILFITTRPPFPLTSGRKVSLYHYCKILHEELGFDVHVLSFKDFDESILDEKVPNFIKSIDYFHNVGKVTKIKNLLWKTFVRKDFPMQVSLYWSKKNHSFVKRRFEELKPEIVIADMVRTTEYAKNLPCKKIADLDDLLSLRYERELQQDLSLINPYGLYYSSLPRFVRKWLDNPKRKRHVLTRESILLKKYELFVARNFDNVVFVAQSEADKINQATGLKNACAVPLGVDANYFGEKIGKVEKKTDSIGFVGQLNVSHNENGILHFIDNILPLILKERPKAKLIVSGGGATAKLLSRASEHVVFLGRVPDLRDTIGQCSCFICPLKFGSGIKTKNLEAMAMGLPVVTTAIGAENINGIDGVHYLIRDKESEFAEAIVKVLSNKELAEKLSQNGKEFVKSNFTWEVAEKKLAVLLKEMDL